MNKQKNFLIVIAVDEYKSPDWAKLNNAVKDASEVISVLTDRYGFELLAEPLFNGAATRVKISQLFANAKNELTDEDNLVIYFAGHGFMNISTHKGYWVPFEADLQPTDMISNSEIKDFIEVLPCKHILLLSDSCFSGTFITQNRGRLARESYKELNEKKSRWVLTSGSEEKVSDGKPDTGSPFALYLKRFLQENINRYSSAGELGRYVCAMTSSVASQHPQVSPISNVGHEDGQMIFCLKTAYVETDEQNTDGKPATQLLRTELRAVYEAKSQYSGGKEVILMDMVGRGDVLVLAENFRFDDDGNKKLTFREGEVLMPDKDGTTAIPIFGRAATMEGMQRFLTENTVKFQDIKIVMWPAHESIDEVESTPAAIDQGEYIQDMMDQNLNVMQCLHCGKIISTNDSYSVEIDEEGLKPNAGNVHKECLRPADRMVGRAIRPGGEQTQLINFDFGKWIELLMTGQGFITGALKSAAKFSGAVISWNRDHYHNSGDYCVRMILEDGSFNYLTIGKDIHRFSVSEIDEELTKLNSEVGIFGKLSITKTFGTVEFLNSIKLGEEVVIPVVKYEKIRYSNQLETKMAKLANDYAPLGLVLDEENKIVRFGDIVPLITDPFTFDELHANWNESGFIDKPCNMQILESDKDVNYYLMIFFGDDLIPVLNPRFASDQSLSSGIFIRQMSEIIKNADKRLE